MIAGTYYVNQVYKSTLFSALILIAGIGTAGVGLLPQDSDIYFVFAYIGYVAFALGAIFSYKYQNKPLNYISIILGILSLVALILWISGVEISSGVTVSPIIADFPVLLWLIGFSAHIIGSQVNNH
jgi:hypothetical membrane protein